MAQPKPKMSQYHHFVPRFILKNFSHPKQKDSDDGKGKKKKRKYKKGSYPGDPMLHILDLTGDGEIAESPVATSYGITDMYRDFSDAGGNQHSLEQELSKLEDHAARILHKIKKDHEAGKTETWLVRGEKDVLRKFLFVMKYRGSGFHRRFFHDKIEDYAADDRQRMLAYIKEKGYSKPIDVWFANIRALVQVDIDADEKWMQWLMEKMYPDDALWAVAHIRMMYLAFCTPSDQVSEFLLTENAYNIFEGPVSPRIDLDTNQLVDGAYTEWHVFAPLSPRLILVLRSNILPDRGHTEEQKQEMLKLYMELANQHMYPDRAGSILSDLPISKAQPSYAIPVDGRQTLRPGEDGRLRKNHRFGFRFHPINVKHVNLINSVMFENASKVKFIAFRSKDAMRATLEWYLSDAPSSYGFKQATGDDERLAHLKKLEKIAQQAGSNVKVSYSEAVPTQIDERLFLHSLGFKMKQEMGRESIPGMEPYRLLGGSDTVFFYDLDQASKMWNMRTKIDVWSKGADEEIRQRNRDVLRDVFCQLLPSRLFLFLKVQRVNIINGLGVKQRRSQQDREEFMCEGSEDVIAKHCRLFRTDRLGAMLYSAALQDIEFTKRPDFDIDSEITFSGRGLQCLREQQQIGFDVAGSICDCGIREVEEFARSFRKTLNEHGAPPELVNPFWSEDMNCEMLTRMTVKQNFPTLVSNRQPDASLYKTLFEIIYPTSHDRSKERAVATTWDVQAVD